MNQTPPETQFTNHKAYALNKLANTTKDWKYLSALTSADKALALNSLNDIALTSKGWTLIDLGRARESIPYLIHATQMNPRNEFAWYNLAWAQYLTNNFAESFNQPLSNQPLVTPIGTRRATFVAIPNR